MCVPQHKTCRSWERQIQSLACKTRQNESTSWRLSNYWIDSLEHEELDTNHVWAYVQTVFQCALPGGCRSRIDSKAHRSQVHWCQASECAGQASPVNCKFQKNKVGQPWERSWIIIGSLIILKVHLECALMSEARKKAIIMIAKIVKTSLNEGTVKESIREEISIEIPTQEASLERTVSTG